MARGPVLRRRLTPSARRQQLLQVGLELLDRQPHAVLSPRAVAQAVGVTPALLYRYFPDKQAFHSALLTETAERFAEATQWPRGGFRQALGASLRAQVGFAVQHPGLWRALQGGSGSAAIRERLRDEQVQRVLGRAGVPPPSARAGILLRGWVGFCTAAIEAWLEDRALSEHELAALLASGLDPALAVLGARTPPRHRDRKPRVRLVASAQPMTPGSPS